MPLPDPPEPKFIIPLPTEIELEQLAEKERVLSEIEDSSRKALKASKKDRAEWDAHRKKNKFTNTRKN